MDATNRSANSIRGPLPFILAGALIVLFAFAIAQALGWLQSISPPDYVEYAPTVLIVQAHGTLDDLARRQREWRNEHPKLEVQQVLLDGSNQRIIVYLKKPIIHAHRPTRKL